MELGLLDDIFYKITNIVDKKGYFHITDSALIGQSKRLDDYGEEEIPYGDFESLEDYNISKKVYDYYFEDIENGTFFFIDDMTEFMCYVSKEYVDYSDDIIKELVK